MCLSPLTIKNYKDIHGKGTGYITVPCGHCEQCLRNKQNYIVQRCQLLSKDHYCYMCTLTYNDDHLPFFILNGQKFSYASVKHVQNLFKLLRKYFEYPFKYLCVSERGKLRHRPHWHILFFVPYKNFDNIDALNIERQLSNLVLKYWCINIGSTRKPIYESLFTYSEYNGRRNFDFHFVQGNIFSGTDDVFFYASKYVLKFDEYTFNIKKFLFSSLPYEEFKKLWNLWKPRLLLSKNFGSSELYRDDVVSMIKSSYVNKHPCFFNGRGQSFPLSPYLYNKFGSLADKEYFTAFKPSIEDEARIGKEIENVISKHVRVYDILKDKY